MLSLIVSKTQIKYAPVVLAIYIMYNIIRLGIFQKKETKILKTFQFNYIFSVIVIIIYVPKKNFKLSLVII